MIKNKDNPVQWALLMYELADAQEHLGKIFDEMNAKGEIDEAEYGIVLGHVYSHLNRAWNSRNRTKDVDDRQFEDESHFPKDIKPI